LQKSSFWTSLRHAWDGFYETLKEERNLRIHMVFAVFAIVMGLLLRVEATGLAVLALTIALVISLELVNTALERTLDEISPEFRPGIRRAKDSAAAAVLVAAVAAVIVGVLLFGGRLLALIC